MQLNGTRRQCENNRETEDNNDKKAGLILKPG